MVHPLQHSSCTGPLISRPWLRCYVSSVIDALEIAHHMQPELWKASIASQQGLASASARSGRLLHAAMADRRDRHSDSSSLGPCCRDAASARAATQRAPMSAAMQKTRAVIATGARLPPRDRHATSQLRKAGSAVWLVVRLSTCETRACKVRKRTARRDQRLQHATVGSTRARLHHASATSRNAHCGRALPMRGRNRPEMRQNLG